jgi:hypothetical protein
MKHLLDSIPGYRSRTKRNMILASIYYILCLILAIGSKQIMPFVLFASIPFIVCSIKDCIVKKSLKSLIPIPICLVLFVVSCFALPSPLSVESIYLDYDTLTMDVADSGQELTFSVQPENASTDGISFIIENPFIAKIENHTLIPIKEGTTSILAKTKDGKVTSTPVSVTITDRKAEDARKVQREQNDVQAKQIKEKIMQIGEVNLLSGDSIDEAEHAYNNASTDVKQLVTNHADLISARQTFTALVEEDEQRKRQAEEQAKKEAEEKAKQQAEAAAKKEQAAKAKQESKSSTSKGSSSSKQTSQTVYRGKTGTKYHRETCPTLKGGGIPISLSDALAQGRDACKVCKP